MTRNNESHRVGQFVLTKLGIKTRTRNRLTKIIELEHELEIDMQTACPFTRVYLFLLVFNYV